MADDESDPDELLGGLADRVRARQSEGAATADGVKTPFDGEEHFQEETYEAIDAEALWGSLEAGPASDTGIEAEDESDENIVAKRSFCETCEHFSEPPRVSCTHPGTAIVEFVDIDHVRVKNCPVVATRQAMGEEEDGPMSPSSFGQQGP